MNGVELAPDVQRLMESFREELPEPAARPVVVVISGLPGTGKSYFSRKLAERFPFLILESDVLRKILFLEPAYSQSESARLFRAYHGLAEELLKRGISLILDATNLSEQSREHLYRIARRAGAKIILVRVVAPAGVVWERMEARRLGASLEDRSDAGWEVYRKMRPQVERIKRRHYVVNTSRDITPVMDKIIREIERSQ